MEYCGHLIDKDGLHYTQHKLETVADFPKPETQHALRSFLGLANWFRDHIRDHSTLVRPLHKVLDSYDKRKKLICSTILRGYKEGYLRLSEDLFLG